MKDSLHTWLLASQSKSTNISTSYIGPFFLLQQWSVKAHEVSLPRSNQVVKTLRREMRDFFCDVFQESWAQHWG